MMETAAQSSILYLPLSPSGGGGGGGVDCAEVRRSAKLAKLVSTYFEIQ
jgi:hypothetical protein